MHCMMTEFLGDWPKPKTLACCSLGPLCWRSREAADTNPRPGVGFCSCESIPGRFGRVWLRHICPALCWGLVAWVECPCLVLLRGDDTGEGPCRALGWLWGCS